MARTVGKRKKVGSWKSKKLYDVLAPKMFGEVKVGETMAADPSVLKGRVIETTARDVSGDFSKQHIRLSLKIEDVKGDNAYTKFFGHKLSTDYMRSQIRRKTTRVEGVVDVKTNDGHRLRVKTIALAVGRAQTEQEKAIRRITADIVTKHAQQASLDGFMGEVISGKLLANMYKAAHKIFPLKKIEISKIKVL